VGQPSATLIAATLQHSAASAARHALDEAVLLGAVTFLGLVGSFWHYKNLA